VPVEHQHPLLGVARDPHQDPAAVGERDLDRAVTAAGAPPDLRGEVDAAIDLRQPISQYPRKTPGER